MGQTKIEWATHTWNPVTGCTPISAGCQNCYAARMARRLAGRCGYDKADPFGVTIHLDRMNQPRSWKKPRRVFVCSMGDLFHKDVPAGTILDIWDTMASQPDHQFIILTKRPERMRQVVNAIPAMVGDWPGHLPLPVALDVDDWPLPNVWLGVTVEDQQAANERVPLLLGTAAAVKLVSCEPMLEPLDLTRWMVRQGHQLLSNTADGGQETVSPIDWIICGGEKGPGARPMMMDWAKDMLGQCQAAGVPFFFKHPGTRIAKSISSMNWQDRMPREFPQGR